MFAFTRAFNKKEAKKISRGQAGSLDDPDPRPARAVVWLCLLLDVQCGVRSASTTSTVAELAKLAHKPHQIGVIQFPKFVLTQI